MALSHETLRSQIQNAAPVLQRLDDEMERIEFDPLRPASVASARVKVEQLIDTLLADFKGKPILGPLAVALKAQYLDAIQARVVDARHVA
ncbi:hypothetical protein [Pseudomonas japonica]|uniref:hypothetical protein n=1 Tax=Pseudomonas japonica TaxID=256466 RepID=UPI0015E3D870|nr:hypothetical protein [Pseudomonas japonica]MBA1289607.1 hypothetical protein [Pseudomonas japonica]